MSERDVRKFTKYLSGGTKIMFHKGDTTKSGYLTFDPCGMSTINYMPTGGPRLEYTRYPGGDPSSDKKNNPTVL